MNPLWIGIPALLLLFVVAAIGRSRRQRLARIRDTWGAPIKRVRRMDAMSTSHAARIAVFPGGRSLDDRTWADLNLDDVFAALDRTHSTLGQHALYHRLRTAPVADHLGAFEALVGRMTLDPTARERAQMALTRLQDPYGYDVWWLAGTQAVEGRSWYAVFPVLTAAAIVLAVLAPFWSAAVMPLVAVLLINVAVRYATDFRIGTIARSFRQCAPLIATVESLQFLAGDDIDPIVSPLRTDVPALARLKLISRWVNGEPFMLPNSPDPLAVGFSDVVAAVYEYLNLAFLLDATGVYFAITDLSRHGGALVRATAAGGEVDAAISIASFRAGRSDWTRPEFRAPDATTELTQLRHPLVADAVANSIALRPGRGVLVTGSNMSGKSTFLRTVGVNAILAQTVSTCLARAYRAPIFHVFSCIGRADDLMTGKSYYIVEVEALLELVRASDDPVPHLFLLDELFRGTNAVERIAAGQAVLLELLRVPGGAAKLHVVLAATHDGELVDLASEVFDAYHFGDSIGPDGLIFDHLLRNGPASTRNAIALLRLHGAPETLLTQAVTTAERLDRQRGTTLATR
jgi:MutS-like protein